MNDEHGFWWDVLKTLSNILGVILAAAFGWLTRRFSKMDERLDKMEREFSQRSELAATNIAVLQSYHQSNLQRLDAIDSKAKDINAKLDTLIWNLANRRSADE